LKHRKGYDSNTIEDDVTLDKRNYILDIPHGKRKWKTAPHNEQNQGMAQQSGWMAGELERIQVSESEAAQCSKDG
jgi:hypothetical protein